MHAKSILSTFRLPEMASFIKPAVVRAVAGLLVLMPLSAQVNAQDKNAVESITASTQQGGKVVVRVNFKAPLGAIPN